MQYANLAKSPLPSFPCLKAETFGLRTGKHTSLFCQKLQTWTWGAKGWAVWYLTTCSFCSFEQLKQVLFFFRCPTAKKNNIIGSGENFSAQGYVSFLFSFLIRGVNCQKRNTSTSRSTHKNVALSMSTGVALQVLAEAIRELLDVFFFLFPFKGKQNGWRLRDYFSRAFYFWFPNWLMIFLLFHGVGVIFWDVEKGTWKILPLVKREGEVLHFREATLLVRRTTDLQNRISKSTASQCQSRRNHVRNQEDC